jgi:hypothetical protein
MPVHDGRIYSYGRHFELGRLLPSGAFLLNGDRYSVTTARHQREVEGAVLKSGRPSATVPYSALSAAGVGVDTVRIIDSRDAGYEVIPTRLGDVQPPEAAQVTVQDNGHTREERYRWGDCPVYGIRYVRGWDYKTGQYVDRPDAPLNLYVGGDGVYERDGGWYVDRYRHWLGASVIDARVNRGSRPYRATFLSAFDENERRPLYFLCELPRGSRPTSYAEALESLKPAAVLAAENAGAGVLRQGDVFAIPAPEHERALWAHPRYAAPGAYVLGTNHTATRVRVTPLGTFARGVLRHEPIGWGREPEHARVKLGDGRALYRLIRNTVPQDNRRSSNGIARQSGTARAWTLGGRVD